MQYGLAHGHRDLSVGALGNLLTFGPNNQVEAERLTLHVKLMGTGGGMASLANTWEITKNVVGLTTNEEALENIKRNHITAKTLLPDAHPVGDWLGRVYTITLENYGILKELAPTRPGDEPITGILLLLKFSHSPHHLLECNIHSYC